MIEPVSHKSLAAGIGLVHKVWPTESNGRYLDGCKSVGKVQHAARYPAKLPEFFIKMLTDPGDLVVDIFAGSNTTGRVAENQRRRWLAFERSREYVASSAFRFLDKRSTYEEMREIFDRIEKGKPVDVTAIWTRFSAAKPLPRPAAGKPAGTGARSKPGVGRHS